jgi:curved DNA-binding protein
MDYYSILGVARNASDKDLKSAYKKLSMQHHPDRGGNEETFKKVNEAYSTLKDPRKRQEYDNPQPQFNFNNMGGDPFGDIFGRMNRRQRFNTDVNITLKIDLKDVLLGKKLSAQYKLPSGDIKEVDIDLPPGVDNDVGVRYHGLGETRQPGPPGDLIVRVRVMHDPRWKRSGDDLRTKVPVSVFTCFLGGITEIRTLDGRNIKMNIPKGTQPGATFSVHGYGIPNKRTGQKGNVLVEINAVVPNIEDPNILKELERIKNAIN